MCLISKKIDKQIPSNMPSLQMLFGSQRYFISSIDNVRSIEIKKQPKIVIIGCDPMKNLENIVLLLNKNNNPVIVSTKG